MLAAGLVDEVNERREDKRDGRLQLAEITWEPTTLSSESGMQQE